MSSAQRVLLKMSGEALSGEGEHGVDPETLAAITQELVEVARKGTQLAVVVGGGNFLRGEQLSRSGIDRVSADFMGMLATVMNGLALRAALATAGVDARVMSAVEATRLVELYSPHRCVEHLEAGRVVVLVGGTGNPYFTTDTCAALRATEIGASWVLKGTKVDGVYSGDPKVDPSATRYERLSFRTALEKRLRVMDTTAIALCMENGLPIRVFDMFTPGNVLKAVQGAQVGTEVLPEDQLTTITEGE